MQASIDQFWDTQDVYPSLYRAMRHKRWNYSFRLEDGILSGRSPSLALGFACLLHLADGNDFVREALDILPI